MEPEPRTSNRTTWIALGILGVAVLLVVSVVFDLGPFAEEDMTETEYLAQADDICSQAHRDFEKLQGSPPRTASEAAELTEELLAISRDEQDAIADLTPPPALTSSVERYLDARDAGIERLREGAGAAGEGDAFAYAEAQADLASTQKERLKIAKRVGFDDCSQALFGPGQLEEDSKPPTEVDPSAPPTVANPPTGAP
jgi:hypothetical protein